MPENALTNKELLEKGLSLAGGVARLARALGAKPGAVQMWKRPDRTVPHRWRSELVRYVGARSKPDAAMPSATRGASEPWQALYLACVGRLALLDYAELQTIAAVLDALLRARSGPVDTPKAALAYGGPPALAQGVDKTAGGWLQTL